MGVVTEGKSKHSRRKEMSKTNKRLCLCFKILLKNEMRQIINSEGPDEVYISLSFSLDFSLCIYILSYTQRSKINLRVQYGSVWSFSKILESYKLHFAAAYELHPDPLCKSNLSSSPKGN